MPEEGAPVHDFVYGISNGLFDPSRASLLVRGQKDWVNPPTATDDVAKPKGGEAATTVDVLANDTDIDSDPATLKVVEVLSPHASITGNKVSVDVLGHPHTVPYVIEDEDGARAMAVVHVPRGSGRHALRRRGRPHRDGQGRDEDGPPRRLREVAAGPHPRHHLGEHHLDRAAAPTWR